MSRGSSLTETRLTEVWTIFDGLPLLYRRNATEPPAGARTIVHIHGFGISGRYLLPTAALLASDYRTFVPDLPGFGRSHHPRRRLTIPWLGEVVVRLMDQLEIDRAILLSNSLGAPITGAVIDTHPDRVEAVVLVSPAGGEYNLPFPKALAQLALAGSREPLGMMPIATRDYARFGVRSSLSLLRSMLAYPAAERVRELTLPTLVVIGSRDPLVSEDHVAEVAVELPHVTAVVIDGAAHAINFSHPGQLAHVVREWLEGRPIAADPHAKGAIRVFETPRAG
jgi:pimeloyl-ACP methyl ester carboxylesterase